MRLAATLVPMLALFCATTHCRTATGIRVSSRSEVDCARRARVAILVARDLAGLHDTAIAPSAVSTRCSASAAGDGNDTGTVVLTPASGDDESIAFAMMTRADGESPETCTDPAQASRCIIARRQLRFSPHDELKVEVELRLSCLGVVCPSEQTCRQGECVSARLPPGCAGCPEGTLGASTAPTCGDAAGLQPGAPWPMAGFCPTRPGRSGRRGPQTPNVRWRFKMGGISSMSPAVAADGTIYVGSNDHVVYAVDAGGNERWRAVLGNNINGTGLVIGRDGTVFVGCADTNIYAIASNGVTVWKTSVGADVALTPSIGGDGTLYVNGLAIAGPAPLFALRADGTVKWQLPARFGVGSPAISPDGLVYVGGTDNTLSALRPSDGGTQWSAPTARPPSTASLGADGTVYAADGQNLYAFAPDGSRKWATPIDGDAGGVALAPDGTIVVAAHSGTLFDVAADGSVRWRFAGPIWSKPPIVGDDGTIYVGGSDGQIWAISALGQVLWTVPTGGQVISQPALGADGTLYAVSADSFLYAIGP